MMKEVGGRGGSSPQGRQEAVLCFLQECKQLQEMKK
jgi:hypothetical protein